MKRPAYLSIAFLALALASQSTQAAVPGPVDPSEPPAPPAGPSSSCHEPRGAIRILTDSEFTAVNGVRRGNGTASDPFVIGCWTVSSNATFAVEFGATTAHFVLRDVAAASTHGRCLYLNGTANGAVERFAAGDCGELVSIHSSVRITVRQSDLKGERSRTKEGIRVWGSVSVNISSNNVSGADIHGIDLCGNLGALVTGNLISRNRLGLGACPGSGEWVHHNRFEDNDPGQPQAWDGGSNRWDDGAQGNWWSDHTGPDENGDGIVDRSYSVGASGAADRFPLCLATGCWWSGGLRASLSANRTAGTAPLEIAFSSNVSGGTPPYSYAWDFGDGGSSGLASPTHRYERPGTYLVELAVEDSAGRQTLAGPLTILAHETEPPRVLSTSPPQGARDVPLDSSIVLEFSAEMEEFSTLAAISISPDPSLGPTWSTDHRRLTLDPARELEVNRTYGLTIAGTAESAGGLPMGTDFVLEFTTVPRRPPERPTVVRTYPADGATGVATNSHVSVAFSVPMEPAATEASISIVPATAGAFSWSQDGREVTLKPSAVLASETPHAVTISADARSAAGARLGSTFVFAFTTGSSADLSPPSVSHAPPSSLAEGRDAALYFRISDPAGVEDATIHFRRAGGSFESARLLLRTGDAYLALIPAAAIATPRIEYYVEAWDMLGNSGLSPASGPAAPYRVPVLPPERPPPDLRVEALQRDLATFVSVAASSFIIGIIWLRAERSGKTKGKPRRPRPRTAPVRSRSA